MIKLAAAVSFYQDLPSLKRGMPTYADGVDYILAWDGRYSLCEGDDFSTQETIDYVKSFPNTIYSQFVGMEHEKRQKYIDQTKELGIDALIIIDSDEWILPDADWKLYRENIEKAIKENPDENIFGMSFRYTPEGHEEKLDTHAKVLVRAWEIEHFKCHCVYRKKPNGKPTRITGMSKLIKGIKITGNDKLRSDFYLKQVQQYQKKMLDYEIPIRNEFLSKGFPC